MKVEVCTVCNTHDTGYRDKVTKSWWVEGDTLEDCFKTVYPSERSLRYCYGYSIKFRDTKAAKKFGLSSFKKVRARIGRERIS